MLINISDIWPVETETKHRNYVENEINPKAAKSKTLKSLFTKFSLDYIATAKPNELRKIINFVSSELKSSNQKEIDDFHTESRETFDYETFTKKDSLFWDAYKLCRTSKYKFCPYCQQNMAITLYRDKKSQAIRPTLDHFYPKSLYPYLSLSLYNLVPSCFNCNSSLKGDTDFFLKPHLHPYEDNEVISHTIDYDHYIEHRKGTRSLSSCISISLDYKNIQKEEKERANRSIDTFLMKDRIDFIEIELSRFIEIMQLLGEGRIEEINRKIFPTNKVTEENILQFSISNYKNEWIGSVKRDLYKKLYTIK